MALDTQPIRTKKHRNGVTHIGSVIDGAEALVAATAELGREDLDGIRRVLVADLEAARSYLNKVETRLQEQATGVNEYIHEKPWQSVAIAVGGGALVGVLFGALAFRR
jgi:ElaB/YqjD/DUF883 family membrane-anchored ribosome-binding protein